LSKKAKRRRRRRSPSLASDNEVVSDDETLKKKKAKKTKEKEQYKSAQFIEDSDEEYGGIEAFLEKERAMREKAARIAAEAGGSIGTMKPTGTKKRRRKAGSDAGGKKKRKGGASRIEDKPIDESQSESSESDIILSDPVKIPSDPSLLVPQTRPKPRPIAKRITSNRSDSVPLSNSSPPPLQFELAGDDAPEGVGDVAMTGRRRVRLVISDEEDD
jgi:replication fork protection complex subunit Tof1/Swi1